VLEYPLVVDTDEDPRVLVVVRAVSEPFPLPLVEVLLVVTVVRVLGGGELPPGRRVVELAAIHTFLVVAYVLLTTTLSMNVVDVSTKDNLTVSAGRGFSTMVEVSVVVVGGIVSTTVETSVTVSV